MRKSFLLLGVLSVLFHLSETATGPTTKKPGDCKFWHGLAAHISDLHKQTGRLRLGCTSTCETIRCSGHIAHFPMIEILHLDKPFCFGVWLNHCSHPVSMDYYLEIPSQNISINDTVKHDDTQEVRGPAGSTIVLRAKMDKVNSTHVLFGVTAGVKASGIFGAFPIEENVFPDTYIDVPPCTTNDPDKTRAPFSPPAVCTESDLPIVTPVPSIDIKSDTYNKSCELGLFQCDKNELCEARKDNQHSRNGKCACDTNSRLSSSTGFCESLDATTIKAIITPMVLPVNSTSEPPKKGKNTIITPMVLPVNSTSEPPKKGKNTIITPMVLPVNSTSEPPKKGKNTIITPMVLPVNSTSEPPKKGKNTIITPMVLPVNSTSEPPKKGKNTIITPMVLPVNSTSEPPKKGKNTIITPMVLPVNSTSEPPKKGKNTIITPMVLPVNSTSEPPKKGKNTIITPMVLPVNSTSEPPKKGKNMMPIIVGGVVGGLLLIVVVISIIVYLGRRRRMAMYRGRQQLLTDDIDDDDDDMHVVI